jgi:hypothetical protein
MMEENPNLKRALILEHVFEACELLKSKPMLRNHARNQRYSSFYQI